MTVPCLYWDVLRCVSTRLTPAARSRASEIEWLRVREWASYKASVFCLSALPQALPPLGWFICNSGLLLYWSVLMSQWSHTLDSALSHSRSVGEKANQLLPTCFKLIYNCSLISQRANEEMKRVWCVTCFYVHFIYIYIFFRCTVLCVSNFTSLEMRRRRRYDFYTFLWFFNTLLQNE